jgi:hypothetical protein
MLSKLAFKFKLRRYSKVECAPMRLHHHVVRMLGRLAAGDVSAAAGDPQRIHVLLQEIDGGGGGEGQGLTLVNFSAQLERFLWDRGCAEGLCSPCYGSVWGCLGCVGCFCVSDTAQVELTSERV